MEFIDFGTGERSGRFGIVFPGWTRGETVAFLSPHDDDAVLGAGYLVRAVRKHGGKPVVIVFCRGDAGYSEVGDKKAIVGRRRRETRAAYAALGVPKEDIVRFDLPDLSLMAHVDRLAPGRRKGAVEGLIRVLRSRRAGRVVFSSAHFENWDHTAVHHLGMYAAPQAGDPILADLGPPWPVSTGLVYAVWGDFEPRPGQALGADLGIIAGEKDERAVREALAAFGSQAAIMANTAAAGREARRGPDGWLELYRRADIRRPINYGPYFRELNKS